MKRTFIRLGSIACSMGLLFGMLFCPAYGQSARSGMGAVPYADSKTGVVFRVWAPHAAQAAVRGTFNNWNDIPLGAESNGFWSADVSGAAALDEYEFVFDGSLIKRDARARQLSVNRNSLVYDDRMFDWEGDAFWATDIDELVIYEMHAGTFFVPDGSTPATLDDAILKLDHLVNLGINAVELMPINEFSSSLSWGYNPSDLFAIERAYGGPDAFKRFVKACHERGLAVLVDVVHNHYGQAHVTADDLPLWQYDGWNISGYGGIYFYNDSTRGMTSWGPRPDYREPQVRAFIQDQIAMFVESYHVDGFRWDATEAMIRAGSTALPEGESLLAEINGWLITNYPHTIRIAENGGVLSAGFQSEWNVGFQQQLKTLLSADYPNRNVGSLATAIVNAHMGQVLYSESHDEVGELNNKDRLPVTISSSDPEGETARRNTLLGAVTALTSPGLPMLFQGQEMYEIQRFHDSVPMRWERTNTHAGITRAFRDLIWARRTQKGLIGGECTVTHVDEAANLLAWHRWTASAPNESAVIVANFNPTVYEGRSAAVTFPHAGYWRLVYSTDATAYGFDGLSEPYIQSEGEGTAVAPLSINRYTANIYEPVDASFLPAATFETPENGGCGPILCSYNAKDGLLGASTAVTARVFFDYEPNYALFPMAKQSNGVWQTTITCPGGSERLEAQFFDEKGALDDHFGTNWSLNVENCEPETPFYLSFATNAVTFSETNAVFQIELTRRDRLTDSVTVDVVTSEATSDFTILEPSLTFLHGETQKWVEISLLDDQIAEKTEVFTFSLTSTSSAVLFEPFSSLNLTILDDDDFGLVAFSQERLLVLETNGIVHIPVQRSLGSRGSVRVSVVQSGSSDRLELLTPELVFGEGETSASLQLAITDDNHQSDVETLTFSLTSPTGGCAVIEPSTMLISLVDDETTPFMTSFDADPGWLCDLGWYWGSNAYIYQANDENSATNWLTMPEIDAQAFYALKMQFQRQFSTENAAFLQFSVDNGANWTNWWSYQPSSDTNGIHVVYSLPPESDGKTVRFRWGLHNGTGMIDDVILTGLPIPDDTSRVAFAEKAMTIPEKADFARISLIREWNTSHEASVYVQTIDETAVGGQHFLSTTQKVTFLPGINTNYVDIPLIDNELYNHTRSFHLTLTDPDEQTMIGSENTCTVAITDDDHPFGVFATPVIDVDHTTRNAPGEQFDFDLSGGFLSAYSGGGFGCFGEIYINYDAQNLYLGAMHTVVETIAHYFILFIDVPTLPYNATNCAVASGVPYGLDSLHNLMLSPGADLAVLLGDEWGDGTSPRFYLKNGDNVGQGAFLLTPGAFTAITNVALSQYDAVGTNPTLDSDDDGNRMTDCWELALPWTALGCTGPGEIDRFFIGGAFLSGHTLTNGTLSANFIGEQLISDPETFIPTLNMTEIALDHTFLPPTVEISAPSAHAEYFSDEMVSLEGLATDRIGQNVTNLHWKSDRDPEFSIVGASAVMSVSETGAHQLTLTAIAPNGTTATAFRTIHLIKDTDTNGLPDDWAATWWTNPAAITATQDSDNDGYNNAAEWIAGTDPLQATSQPRLCSQITPDHTLQLQWDGPSNRIYDIYGTTNLLQPMQLLTTTVSPSQNLITLFTTNTLQAAFRLGIRRK